MVYQTLSGHYSDVELYSTRRPDRQAAVLALASPPQFLLVQFQRCDEDCSLAASASWTHQVF